jgi:predicted TIM-barrel fold metal-dependent hydrolase
MSHNHLDEKPLFKAPLNACDSHFHVFGPAQQYPYGSDLRYAPPHAPLSEYLQLAKHLGLSRFVFVQPSAYARDNRCMLDAMAEVGVDHCRGVVDVHEGTDLQELKALDRQGVRGVRINVSPVHPFEEGLALTLEKRILTLHDKCQDLKWHLDFLLPGWLTLELMPVLESLRIPFSMAHLGMNLAKDGINAPGFKALLNLVNSGERHAHVKFTGIYRMSKTPGYTDADPLAKALISQSPDRIIWGSDYPHLSFAEHSSVALFNLLDRWCESDQQKKLILSDNPQRFFGF